MIIMNKRTLCIKNTNIKSNFLQKFPIQNYTNLSIKKK